MVSYAVTGASRGLGFEHIRQLSANPSNIIFALVRNTTSSPKLTALAASNPNVHILPGDLNSITQLQEAAEKVSSVTGGSLDILINNGAYLDTETPGFPATSLSSPENIEKVNNAFYKGIDTNVLGAIHVTNTFLPLILKGTEKKIIHISSAMGDSTLVLKGGIAGAVSYSATKAMLNLVVAKFAVELAGQGVLILSLSPGWVDTDEGEPTPESKAGQQYLLSLFQKYDPKIKGRTAKEVSVKDQLETIGRVTMESSGKMISQHGNEDWF
ncbi:putative oxidoreductase [Lachnellula subtilissima]|uniref:Putative oxidoreductase n=1 Tax=Lachnellula subtilissima TaxID=602034 RepID=A0A8H8RF25_9HELO|nr:putative oxidoreductase [Lachnellula subtilissima]